MTEKIILIDNLKQYEGFLININPPGEKLASYEDMKEIVNIHNFKVKKSIIFENFIYNLYDAASNENNYLLDLKKTIEATNLKRSQIQTYLSQLEKLQCLEVIKCKDASNKGRLRNFYQFLTVEKNELIQNIDAQEHLNLESTEIEVIDSSTIKLENRQLNISSAEKIIYADFFSIIGIIAVLPNVKTLNKAIENTVYFGDYEFTVVVSPSANTANLSASDMKVYAAILSIIANKYNGKMPIENSFEILISEIVDFMKKERVGNTAKNIINTMKRLKTTNIEFHSVPSDFNKNLPDVRITTETIINFISHLTTIKTQVKGKNSTAGFKIALDPVVHKHICQDNLFLPIHKEFIQGNLSQFELKLYAFCFVNIIVNNIRDSEKFFLENLHKKVDPTSTFYQFKYTLRDTYYERIQQESKKPNEFVKLLGFYFMYSSHKPEFCAFYCDANDDLLKNRNSRLNSNLLKNKKTNELIYKS